MNCVEAAECVSALFDGEAISREVAAHVADCPECRVRLNKYAEIGAELRDLASTDAPRAVPEGRWRLAEPAAANNWLRKWRGTMRIPRFAFALMLIAIFALSGGLMLFKARAGERSPVLSLEFKFRPGDQGPTCSTEMDRKTDVCSFGIFGLPGHMWGSARFLGREGERVELAIKTVYHATDTLQEHNGETADVALRNVAPGEYWLEPGVPLSVPVEGLGNILVFGRFVSLNVASPKETLDSDGGLQLLSPVLIRGDQVVVNMAGYKAVTPEKDPATMLYSPGLGRFVFSSAPFKGAVEGKVRFNQVIFNLEGKSYLLLTEGPISRSEHVWVLYQSDWRPSASMPSKPMIGSGNLHEVLEKE